MSNLRLSVAHDSGWNVTESLVATLGEEIATILGGLLERQEE
jgi:hypothetical protein